MNMILKVNKHMPVSYVFLAIILLLGVIILTVGFYQNSEVAQYSGIIIIVLGVIIGILKIVIYPNK
jgi:ABC-type transport system involved in cytochrome c biogenesis permease subunit